MSVGLIVVQTIAVGLSFTKMWPHSVAWSFCSTFTFIFVRLVGRWKIPPPRAGACHCYLATAALPLLPCHCCLATAALPLLSHRCCYLPPFSRYIALIAAWFVQEVWTFHQKVSISLRATECIGTRLQSTISGSVGYAPATSTCVLISTAL